MWEGQIPVLEQAGYEVVAPSLPGREPDADLSSWARRILELLPGEFVPVGISMGGYLTFELWRQAPKRIPALVLADTRANVDDEKARAAREETIHTLRERGFDEFWESLEPKLCGHAAAEEVIARARSIASEQPVESLVATVEALRDRADSTSTLADIGVPTLVLVGEEDRTTTVRAARVLHEGISGSALTVIPAVGHMSFMEAPDAYLAAVRTFLRRVARES